MTLGKKAFYLSSAVLLAGAMGVAQTSTGGSSQDQDSSMAGQAAGAQLRGCLTGSDGNYTLTDHSGSIYHLVGGAAQLQNSVGHEVEVTGTPDARRTGASDDTATNTASSFQVTSAREVGARCDHGSASGTMNNNSHPMSEQPPTTDHQPKGAPGEGVPPQPQPQTMAMLQQPGSSDMGGASSASAGQNSQNGAATGNGTPGTPPPVTSQTPAGSQSPTNPNSQLGAGTASQTGASTAAGASGAGQPGRSQAQPQARILPARKPARPAPPVRRARPGLLQPALEHRLRPTLLRARRTTPTSHCMSGRLPTFHGPIIPARAPQRQLLSRIEEFNASR